MAIPIILTTYERPEYFSSTLASMLKSNACLDDLYIFDDCSRNKTKKELLEVAKTTFNVIIRNENKGTVINSVTAIDHVYEKSDSKYIVYVQDDVIFSKTWLETGLKKLQQISEKQFKIAYISLYNRDQEKTKTRIMTGHPGGVCWIINRDFWTWYRATYKNRDTDYMVKNNNANSTKHIFDYKLQLRIRESAWRIACVGKSLVQHIGDKSSLHNNCMAYCRVNNFVGENA